MAVHPLEQTIRRYTALSNLLTYSCIALARISNFSIGLTLEPTLILTMQ